MTRSSIPRALRPAGVVFALSASLSLAGDSPNRVARVQVVAESAVATSTGEQPAWTEKVSPDLVRAATANAGTVEVVIVFREPAEFRLEGPASVAAAPRLAFIQRTGDELDREYALVGVRVKERYAHLPFVLADVPASLLDVVAADPRVASLQPNREVHAMRVNGKAMLDVAPVAALGLDGTGIGVAVLDSGVDYNVPELAPGGTDATAKTVKLWNAIDDNDDPMDLNGHGTSVAGIIAGAVDGVAPKARIVAVRVLDASGSSKNNSVYKGVQKVIASIAAGNPYNIRAVNLSLGGLDPVDWPPNAGNCDAIAGADRAAFDTLVASGALVVVSAGNDGCSTGVAYPACVSSAMAVGAVYNTSARQRGFKASCGPAGECYDSPADAKMIACYSNSGDKLDVWAPSNNTVTPRKGSTADPLTYDYSFGGTSAAAPYVAGVAALLAQAKPSASAATIRNAMKDTGQAITDTRNTITRNLVDAKLAYDKVMSGVCDLPAAPQGAAADKSVVWKSERVTTTWQTVADATSYTVQAASDPAFTDASPFTVTAPTITLYDSSTDAPYLLYLRVRANNACGPGVWSNTVVVSYMGKYTLRKRLAAPPAPGAAATARSN